MTKLLSAVLAAVLTLGASSCGSQNAGANNAGTPAAGNVPSAEQQVQPNETADSDILIAYFSRSGNTEKLAQMIASETGGDLFVIEPETPYPDDYDTLLDQAKKEQNENARPAVKNTVENWDDYSTVFIGYPIWWGRAPMIVLTFAESYDWSGKTLIPFCTSGGSGISGSLSSITEAAPGAKILDGFHVNGSQADSAQNDVADWIASLNP